MPRPALVIGSTQSVDGFDRLGLETGGVDLVRRRSGGGAVLLQPGGQVWVDLLVPADHHLWDPDVGRAAWWAGESWVRAIAPLVPEPIAVHRAGLVRTPWSALVCFAGLGPGAVTSAGRKVVGISQRRTRYWTRIQTVAFTTPDMGGVADLLALDAEDRAEVRAILESEATSVPAAPEAVESALLEAIPG